MEATQTQRQTCYRHPKRETGVSCSNCGRPICPECMTSTSVGMRCPECARQTTKVRVGPGAISPPAGQMPATIALIAINVIVFLIESVGGGAGQFSGGGVGDPRRGPVRPRHRERGLVPADHRRLPARRDPPPRLQHVRALHRRQPARTRRSGRRASSASTSFRCSPARSARCCSTPTRSRSAPPARSSA